MNHGPVVSTTRTLARQLQIQRRLLWVQTLLLLAQLVIIGLLVTDRI